MEQALREKALFRRCVQVGEELHRLLDDVSPRGRL